MLRVLLARRRRRHARPDVPVKRSSIKSKRPDNHLTREEWRIVRHNLAVRSGHRCEKCGISTWGLSDDLVEVQHRRAQGMGGTSRKETNSLANLLLLHRDCHRWVESRPSDPRGPQYPDLAEQRGLWVRHDHDDDGNPVPVETYPLVLESGRRVLLNPTVPIYDDHPDPWGVGSCVVPR